jgi:malonyl-CoA decarboxylase
LRGTINVPGARATALGSAGAATLFSQIRERAGRAKQTGLRRELEQLCLRLLSEGGSSNSAHIAAGIIEAYSTLDAQAKLAFFEFLDRSLGLDPVRVLEAATRFARDPVAERALEVQRVTEPPRQELLRRINRAPGGTAAIVAMRRDLLRMIGEHPQLRAADSDFRHLLASWFNPGFLFLQRVDWQSPAALLEKIIRHEAVHAITDWSDLRRRLRPDRRCFGFFHPQLPGEPLIFVEVALLDSIPRSIGQVIGGDDDAAPLANARIAAFYSIRNCEPGLRGVSLGSFLIKQVAEQLRGELPSLRRFCTLSPIPAFRGWLERLDVERLPEAWPARARAGVSTAVRELRARHGSGLEALAARAASGALSDDDQRRLALCAGVFLACESTTGRADPVARFHLDNGARLERINPAADLTAKAVDESLGVMVNYLYDLDAIEANHERFVRGEVVRSRAIAGIT